MLTPAQGRGRGGRARRGLALAGSLAAALLAAEISLRLAGEDPFTLDERSRNEPLLYAPDPVLGWRARPGEYAIPAYAERGADVRVTIWPDGSRATSAAPVESAHRVLLLGCSFTFGWAISDEDTFAWKLQALEPEVRVVNRGVNAFGTHQALLLLEEIFASGRDLPERVIYGFHEIHERRNVAAPQWLASLSRMSSRGNVAVPYATLDAGGELVRHPPESHPAWPLRSSLATVAFLEEIFTSRDGVQRLAQARAVTERLIVAMRDLCARHGVRFDVVLLQVTPTARRDYESFLSREGIPYADCVVPITPDLRVAGEGHPNAKANGAWAQCIESKVLGFERR